MYNATHCTSPKTRELNQSAAQEVYREAINKITKLTGLNAQQSSLLLHQQFQQLNSAQTNETLSLKEPVLRERELMFIAGLFY